MPGATDEALERLIVRCPCSRRRVAQGARAHRHDIMQDGRGPRESVLTEVRGLRSGDAYHTAQPGVVVQLDCMGPRVHLVLDVAVTCDVSNFIAAQVAVQPGYAARMRELTKFRVDASSSQSVARRHSFVPCVVEDGRLVEQRSPYSRTSRSAASPAATSSNPPRGARSGQLP